MDDFDLANEVLELTLACQQGEPVPQEHARLERALEVNPQAIVWYLRVADDTVGLRDAAATVTTETGTISPETGVLPSGLGSLG